MALGVWADLVETVDFVTDPLIAAGVHEGYELEVNTKGLAGLLKIHAQECRDENFRTMRDRFGLEIANLDEQQKLVGECLWLALGLSL